MIPSCCSQWEAPQPNLVRSSPLREQKSPAHGLGSASPCALSEGDVLMGDVCCLQQAVNQAGDPELKQWDPSNERSCLGLLPGRSQGQGSEKHITHVRNSMEKPGLCSSEQTDFLQRWSFSSSLGVWRTWYADHWKGPLRIMLEAKYAVAFRQCRTIWSQ